MNVRIVQVLMLIALYVCEIIMYSLRFISNDPKSIYSNACKIIRHYILYIEYHIN